MMQTMQALEKIFSWNKKYVLGISVSYYTQ